MSNMLWAWSVEVAASITGLRMVWTWAFLEAIFLPLPPEVLLIPLAVAAPERTIGLALTAVAGSLVGGCVSYVLGRWFGDRTVAVLQRLPGASRDKVLWSSSMLNHFGVRFIAVSPWLVLPYKITSVLSGRFCIPWWRYILAGAFGRGTRLMAIAAVVGLVAQANQPFIQVHYFIAAGAAYVAAGGIVWVIRSGLLHYWVQKR